ncbi:hypothetical protein [Enterococcus sp. JM9B]|uniref:hypothetical protein n=1 Tax=Enterococcus sp. JM9B TaxID=1857216 RepID=UPI001374AF9E|nr:hypothetical protein [Enterococcus sp. JM9B]KAF1303702.1 hypothetical protein BAU16_03815 [Enterococcus sp. JM9B]
MNETFAVMYIINGQYYPIALTAEQQMMIQTFLKGLFASTGNGKLNLIDQPFGNAINLVAKKD